jgi:O-antigen/teichoic acid export membrane protein
MSALIDLAHRTEPLVAADPTADVDASIAQGAPHARASIGRNLTAMMSSQVLSWILGTVAQLIQPRFLGPEQYGRLQLAFSLWLIAQVVVGLGTGLYLQLVMARDPVKANQLIGPILLLRMSAFAVASVLMAGYALLVGFDREMMLLLAISGATMLLMTIADVYASAFVGLERMFYVSSIGIGSKVVYTIVMVVVLVAGGGVIGLALVTTLNAGLTLVLFAYFYRAFGRVSFQRTDEGFRTIVRHSSPFMVGGVILTLYLQVDMVVMSLLVEDATLGWYTSADVLAHSISFVPAVIVTVLFPVVARLHVSDTEKAANIVRRAFSVLFLAGVGVGWGLAVIAQPFVLLIYGDEFENAGPVLAAFGLAAPLLFITVLLGTVAMATGRQRYWNTLMAIAVVMSIAFDLVMVPVFDRVAGNGAIAGALGYTVTEAFMVFVGIRKIAPDVFQGASMARILKTVLAGVAMVVAVWPFRNLFLPIPIFVGVIVFAGAVLLLRIPTDDDWELGRRLLAKVGLGTRTGTEDHDDETLAASVTNVFDEEQGS